MKSTSLGPSLAGPDATHSGNCRPTAHLTTDLRTPGRVAPRGRSPVSRPRHTPLHDVLACLFLVLAALAGSDPASAAGFSEPPIVLYGRILRLGPGTASLWTEGRLEVRLVQQANPSIVVRLETRLSRIGDDGIFSYALPIAQKYLPGALETDTVLATGPTPETYRFESFTVDGFPAYPLDEAVDSFATGFLRRAAQIRVDLRVSVPETDLDGDGIPDAWETAHGLNPSWPGDASRDSDGDGWPNATEYRHGTDPNVSDARPRLVTRGLSVTERGRAGLYLELVDSDSAADQVQVRILTVAPGFQLELDERPVGSGTSLSLDDFRKGRLALRHVDASVTQGTLQVAFQDETGTGGTSDLALIVRRPSREDGTDTALWLDAYGLATPGAPSLVDLWSDRSGRGRHATQEATPGYRPSFDVDEEGRPGVRFGGLQTHLLLDDAAFEATQQTVFAVFGTSPRETPAQVLAANGLQIQLAPSIGPASHPGAQEVRWPGSRIRGTQDLRDGLTVVAVRRDDLEGSGLAGFAYDGPALADGEPLPPVYPALGVRRGIRGTETVFEQPLPGLVHEVLVFPHTLTESRFDQAIDYLHSKWRGVTVWNLVEATSPVTLTGTDGPDILRGGWGTDTLQGGRDDDLLAGGPGDDRMTGGEGADRFLLRWSDTGRKTITDFTVEGVADVLDMSALFAGVSGDARDHLRLRATTVRRDGRTIPQTLLSIHRDRRSDPADREIVLEELALSDADLGWLIGEGRFDVGDLTIPTELDIEVSAPRTREGGPGVDFTVTRTGNTATALDVPLRVGGSAVVGRDFAWIGSDGDDGWPHVSLARGETSKVIRFEPQVDAEAESAETIQVELLPRRAYSLRRSSASVTLEDAPAVTLAVIDGVAQRNGQIPATVDLRRTGDLQTDLVVRLELGGTAVNGRDYDFLPPSIRFAPGQAVVSLSIRPNPAGLGHGASQTVDLSLVPDDRTFAALEPWFARLFIVDTRIDGAATFAGWRSTHFPDLTGDLAAFATGDADRDGLSELDEYVFGTDPRTPDAAARYALAIHAVGGFLQLRFTTVTDLTDVAFHLLGTSDLTTWNLMDDEFDLGQEPYTGGKVHRRFQSKVPNSSLRGGSFYRLRIDYRPPPAGAVGAGATLEAPSLAFGTEGQSAWKIGDDGASLVSGRIGDLGSSSLVTRISGPGQLRFAWSVSSQSPGDVLECQVDGLTKARISGEHGWTSETVLLDTPGLHSVRWVYRKDAEGSSGLDRGFLRRISLHAP